MKSRIFLIRHGETDWNREQRFQGQIDVPLNDLGRSQARDIAAALLSHLHGVPLSQIYSSDLSRASETAAILAATLGAQVLLDNKIETFAELREAHLGKAQGLTRDQIEAAYGTDLFFKWRASHHLADEHVRYPDGESGREVTERAIRALRKIISSLIVQQKTPLSLDFHLYPLFFQCAVVCHGGTMRRIIQHIYGEKTGSQIAAKPLTNGSLVEIVFNHKTDLFEGTSF